MFPSKWLGMGNQELLSYFKGYHAIRARHSYGPQGHRGIGVLIFESRPSGYFAAESLHNEFVKQGLDKEAWASGRPLYIDGLRQLFGALATKEDMVEFNKHYQGYLPLNYFFVVPYS